MKIQDLFHNCIGSLRGSNFESSGGQHAEIEISIYDWVEEYKKIPSKKELVGKDVMILVEDLDNDDENYYIGTIEDYKFVNELKKKLMVFLKECRRV
jgi:hypothetical protein